MAHFRRLGRRFSVPSTAQILHEFRALSANEDARLRCANDAGLPETASWEDIVGYRAQLEAASESKVNPTQSTIAEGQRPDYPVEAPK